METNIMVETPKDSTILAYGTAPGGRSRALMVALTVFLSACLTIFLLSWGLNRKLPVDAITILLITRPSVARTQLSDEIRNRLPSPWQKALEGESRLPVMLGGGLGPNGWQWFAVMPRWRAASGWFQHSEGLARIIYSEELVTSEAQVRYLDAWKTWLKSPRDEAHGWFELGDVSASSSAMEFGYRQGIARTSLKFEHPIVSFNPRDADLSLDISSFTGSLRDQLTKELPVPRFVQFSSLKEIHLTFPKSGLPETVQLVHSVPLSQAQSQQVLAGFGVTTKRVIRLSDGTLATELTTTPSETTEPIRLNDRTRLILGEKEIRYGSSTDPLQFVPLACGDRPIAGRISASALDKMVKSIGLNFNTSALTPWQVGEDKNGMLILCKESTVSQK